MARRGRTKSNRQRDHNSIANAIPALLTDTTASVKADRRRYHPEGRASAPLSTSGRPARVTVSPARVRRGPGGRPLVSGTIVSPRRGLTAPTFRKRKSRAETHAYANPFHVLVCIRRKMRKEVLFALRKKGRGGKRRRSWLSNIRC